MSDAERAMAWLAKNPQCELSYPGWDDEDAEWRVHAVHGGRNDREWTLIGQGETPLAALLDAMQRKVKR